MGNLQDVLAVVYLNLSESAQNTLTEKQRSLLVTHYRGAHIGKIQTAEVHILQVNDGTYTYLTVSIHIPLDAYHVLT